MPWEEPPDEEADAWKKAGDDSGLTRENQNTEPDNNVGDVFDIQRLFRLFCNRYPATWIPLDPDQRLRIRLTNTIDGKQMESDWEIIAEAIYGTYCAYRKTGDGAGAMQLITEQTKNEARNRYLWNKAKPWLKTVACISAPVIAAIGILLAGTASLDNGKSRPEPDRKTPATVKAAKERDANLDDPQTSFKDVTKAECIQCWGVDIGSGRIRFLSGKLDDIPFLKNGRGAIVTPRPDGSLAVIESAPEGFGTKTRTITIRANGTLEGERTEFERGGLLEP